jgi:O-antigen ligase
LCFLLIFNQKLNNRYVSTTKYLFFNLDKERYLNEIIKLEEDNIDHSKYNSVYNYIGLFKTSLLMFKDSPLIGKGPRSFKYMSAEERFNPEDINGKKVIYYNSHPHNFYIQLMAETGLLGFLYISILFALLLYNAFLNLKRKYSINKNYEIIMFSGFFIILWPFITTGSFFNNWLSIFHFFLLGFFFSNVYKNNLFKIK